MALPTDPSPEHAIEPRLHPSPALERLWAQYARSGDRHLRDRLVFTLAPIVRRIVFARLRRIPARRHAEEFLACGLEALIAAVEDRDAAGGAPLERFAFERVVAAVDGELARPEARRAPQQSRRRAAASTASSSALA